MGCVMTLYFILSLLVIALLAMFICFATAWCCSTAYPFPLPFGEGLGVRL